MKTESTEVRVDLHVHSSYSDKPYSWFLRSNHSAECYTAPRTVYETAMQRGMNLVTISDHDTIEGALELAALYDNTFISEEISARFPEDGCIVHTIALDISEAQHAEIQRLRTNIYDLMRYLDQEDIAYFWCHPLSDVNHRLTKSHIERCFLMFRALELRNGTRDRVHEDRLVELVDQLTPATMARWAEAYPQVPALNLDGRYAYTGGSDDHGGIAIARAYTAFDGPATGAGAAAALKAAATRPGGEAGEGTTLAHNCYGVAAGYFRSSGQLGGKSQRDRGGPSVSMISALARRKSLFEAEGGRLDLTELASRGHSTSYQEELLGFVEPALISGWREVMDKAFGAAGNGRVAEVADGVAEAIKATLIELPYILAHRYHVRDRNKAEGFYESFGLSGEGHRLPRVAIITDSLDNVDGVSLGLRRLHAEAHRLELPLDLVGVSDVKRLSVDDEGVVRLPSVYEHRLAEQPGYAWRVPHLPSLLRYLTEARIDMLQCSTPGPAGFAGLAAARILGIPVIGQYHTDVPEYALRLTGDPTVANLVRMIVSWFYRAMDRTLVPSEWVASLVRDMGVPAQHIHRVPRGIDLELFHHARRDEHAFAEYGLNGEPKVLYVGRVSKEKGLTHLAAGFRALSRHMPEARLVVVGDGPYTSELADEIPGDKVVFTGRITGEKLARLYASSDVFAFPSETETFGNVVVEAQATGLPVIVADRGAARENMREGETGLVVDPRDAEAWGQSLKRLLEDASLRGRMSIAAQDFARRYNMDEAVRGTFARYADILSELRGAPAARSDQAPVPADTETAAPPAPATAPATTKEPTASAADPRTPELPPTMSVRRQRPRGMA
ncbi:glycosyltransferase [Haliangium sp.]|uniref:glycosyltransferase n=1 Tax=Haliangium sp. TaxID=2663208 RepID=UPI003D114973